MGRLLITQSLISAWAYMFDCYEGHEDSAREAFERALRREPTDRTGAMQNGIDFENCVYAEAAGRPRGPHAKWEDGIQAVANQIRGAQTQVKASMEIEAGGEKLLLYGILDALKAGVIYDVKFSKSYEAGKYLNSAQHPAYFRLIPEAYEFRYLISDGTCLYTEVYRRVPTRPIEGIIAEFLESLRCMGYMETYREKWAALS